MNAAVVDSIPAVAASRMAGNRREDRADDRQQLEDAGQHGQEHREAGEDRVDGLAEHDEPDERRDADDQSKQDLAADP